MKAHICVGVRTNVVTAAEIGPEHDGQHFPALLRATAENFAVGDVTADKAYLSLPNVELVAELGGTPFIPPKVGSKADRPGEAWRRMFHLFGLNRDEFCRRYHQRSNVESTFSMVKRKFGDSVRAKTPTAMTNEVLAKLVCHNVVCCIHEMHELGIDPGFGGSEREPAEDDGPRVIRFPGA